MAVKLIARKGVNSLGSNGFLRKLDFFLTFLQLISFSAKEPEGISHFFLSLKKENIDNFSFF